MSEAMLEALAIVLVLVIGAAYVVGAIRARRKTGGLIRYTIRASLAAMGAIVLLLATRLDALALFLIPAIFVFLTPVCVLASAIVEVSERQSDVVVRRALAAGAVLCFGVWAGVLVPKLLVGLAGMNPDGHQRSSLTRPVQTPDGSTSSLSAAVR